MSADGADREEEAETYRLARPGGSTWRPHAEPSVPSPGEFREALPSAEPKRDGVVTVLPRRRRARHPLQRLLLGDLPLESETTIFILVNLLDFFVTYWLLMSAPAGNRRFVESNPIARYFIESWGPVKGMLGFKLTIVTFVCLVAQLIAMRREDLGRKVLLFGTVATGAVVVYSVVLYVRHA